MILNQFSVLLLFKNRLHLSPQRRLLLQNRHECLAAMAPIDRRLGCEGGPPKNFMKKHSDRPKNSQFERFFMNFASNPSRKIPATRRGANHQLDPSM
jgi:hypothetical protein